MIQQLHARPSFGVGPTLSCTLHWELHIDGHYLGIGLSVADTRAVYTALFADAGGTQK